MLAFFFDSFLFFLHLQTLQIFIESRITDIHTLSMLNLRLALSGQAGDGEGHGNAVVQVAVESERHGEDDRPR